MIFELFMLCAGGGGVAYMGHKLAPGMSTREAEASRAADRYSYLLPERDEGYRYGGSGMEEGYRYGGTGSDDGYSYGGGSDAQAGDAYDRERWQTLQSERADRDSDRATWDYQDGERHRWSERADMDWEHSHQQAALEARWQAETLASERERMYRDNEEYLKAQREAYDNEVQEELYWKRQHRYQHESPYEQELNREADWRDFVQGNAVRDAYEDRYMPSGYGEY